MRPTSWTTALCALGAAACSGLARSLGARPVDALLAAVPAVLPLALRRLPVAERRRLLRVQAPVLGAASLGGAVLLAAHQSTVLMAPLPWASAAWFGVYVFAWCVALRLLHALLVVGAARLLRQRALCAVVVAAATLLLLLPNLYVALQTHRIAIGVAPAITMAMRQRGAIPFHCTTADGVELVGDVLPQRDSLPGTPAVLVCHGLGANRASFFGYAELAHEIGAHAIVFDFRAHGDSGGIVSTLGADEVLDVEAVAAWLRRQPRFATCPIVLVGVSMGGAVALRAAASVGAGAVLVESAYSGLDSMVARQVVVAGPFAGVAAWLIAAAAHWQLGIVVDQISPRRSRAALPADVPVVLLHAADDRVIPREEGERLASARPGQPLHLIADAGHGGCLTADPLRIERELVALLAAVQQRRPTPTGGR